ncbi:DNA-directed RNA polymerase subunit K [uncultured archaeon]|nr:DNA-directed RNA polymerase subunit K [uncultured archaeon]
MKEELTKYEKARLIGARALQLKMGAPVLAKLPAIALTTLEIAKLEYEKDVIPLTIKRK